MNITRMKEVVKFFENLPEKQFNISLWVSSLDGDGYLLEDHGSPISVNNCQSAGCIAGWVCAIYNGGSVSYDDLYEKHYGNADDSYADYDSEVWLLEAASKLDLNHQQAQLLFYINEASLWFKYKDDYGFEVTYPTGNTAYIQQESVKTIHVVDMLNRIIRGEIKEML